jgi:hypothetical protein
MSMKTSTATMAKKEKKRVNSSSHANAILHAPWQIFSRVYVV